MSGIYKDINENFSEKSSGQNPPWQEPKDEFLSAFFECSGQGLVITDIDFTIVRFNMMGEMLMDSIFGINLNNTFNLNLASKNQNTAMLQKLLVKARQNIAKSEFFTLTPETNRNQYIVHVRPIFDLKGNHLGTGIGIRNITDTKRAEQELSFKISAIRKRSVWQAQQLKKLNELRKQNVASNLQGEVLKTEDLINSFIEYCTITDTRPVIISFSKLIEKLLPEFDPAFISEQHIHHKKRFKSNQTRTELLMRSLLLLAKEYQQKSDQSSVSLKINANRNSAQIEFSFVLSGDINITAENLQLQSENAESLNKNLFIAGECIRDLEGSLYIGSAGNNRVHIEIFLPNH